MSKEYEDALRLGRKLREDTMKQDPELFALKEHMFQYYQSKTGNPEEFGRCTLDILGITAVVVIAPTLHLEQAARKDHIKKAVGAFEEILNQIVDSPNFVRVSDFVRAEDEEKKEDPIIILPGTGNTQ